MTNGDREDDEEELKEGNAEGAIGRMSCCLANETGFDGIARRGKRSRTGKSSGCLCLSFLGCSRMALQVKIIAAYSSSDQLCCLRPHGNVMAGQILGLRSASRTTKGNCQPWIWYSATCCFPSLPTIRSRLSENYMRGRRKHRARKHSTSAEHTTRGRVQPISIAAYVGMLKVAFPKCTKGWSLATIEIVFTETVFEVVQLNASIRAQSKFYSYKPNGNAPFHRD